jgi:hypothetical protein
MLSLNESLRQINAGLARIREFRPLWKDEYSCNPVLTPEAVAAFETRHGCRLPQDYREFLLKVGDGGAGPDCGIFELGQHFSGSGHEDCLEDDVDLSIAFPHAEAWNAAEGDETNFAPEDTAGSMIIGDYGCGIWTRLVITGPLAGEIWHDDRTNGQGIYPHLAPDGSRYQFLPWYLDWLARRVHQYGHKGNPNPDPGEGAASLPDLVNDELK